MPSENNSSEGYLEKIVKDGASFVKSQPVSDLVLPKLLSNPDSLFLGLDLITMLGQDWDLMSESDRYAILTPI
ncbi:hypothetical protein DYY67_1366 [Candidatus Nitrosotalea sp. TS]|uniref:hypothetical protein n=1 Tax=Candidatus Nitrosotalea sp. TS TaxID=2341020 RepID=UPI001409658B|nr:hypothetical protein [Candidatus Nitrosotalea sp. TS]NHI03571.1 hypothetical protein [Candidatus Nitrosotalea sp. TS]